MLLSYINLGHFSTSQAHVERKLDEFIREFKEGKREGSAISNQTEESLSADEKHVWRAIRKELEEIGITVNAFNANKDFIINWLTEAVANGAFEEQISGDVSIAETSKNPVTNALEGSENPTASQSDSCHSVPVAGPGEKASQTPFVSREGPVGTLEEKAPQILLETRVGSAGTPIRPVTKPRPPNSPTANATIASATPSRIDLKGNRIPVGLSRNAPPQRPQIPRVAALIAGLSRPKKGLIAAAQNGDRPKLVAILRDDSKASLVDSKSLTQALCVAAMNGHEPVVQELVQRGVDVKTKEGGKALYLAAERGHEKVMRLLIKKGADVKTEEGGKALQLAAESGHEKAMRLLIKKGADVNTGNLLHVAVQKGHESVVRLLLEQGANVNARDDAGRTALWWAAESGQERVVQLLLERGADASAQENPREYSSLDLRGCRLLHRAAAGGYTAVVRLLLENGAYDGWDDLGQTALQRAVENGHEAVVRLLLENKAGVNAMAQYRDSALHRAVKNGHEALVLLLLENGAWVNARDQCGRTPLWWAIEKGLEQILQLLVEKGANMNNVAGGRNSCALQVAAEKGDRATVQLLLDMGANVDGTCKYDFGERNPLFVAAERGHESVVIMLLESGADPGRVDFVRLMRYPKPKTKRAAKIIREYRKALITYRKERSGKHWKNTVE
jgi:ankyrin repeat protein